jgi:hypothetical protein
VHDAGPFVDVAPPEGGPVPTCTDSPPPSTAVRSVSLALTGVDFGDSTPTAWKTIGFDLDGKCTTSSSTDVCTLVAGAPKSVQVDGAGGIDNSWGANICPIFDATAGTGSCSTRLGQVLVATDASGTGRISILLNGEPLQFSIFDTYVVTNGSGGVLAAVTPATDVVAAMQAIAGSISISLCSGSAFDSIAQQISQASDILANGSNAMGSSCDAISLGLTFTGSSTFGGTFPTVNNPCANDASAD